MSEYVSRIPIHEEYANMLGKVLYNFAYVEWVIVYLGSLYDPKFLNREPGNDSGAIADAFKSLAEARGSSDLIGVADRFSKAELKRIQLLRATPITGPLGAQILQDSGASTAGNWTLDDLVSYAEELQTLAIEPDDLYYKLKPKA